MALDIEKTTLICPDKKHSNRERYRLVLFFKYLQIMVRNRC